MISIMTWGDGNYYTNICIGIKRTPKLYSVNYNTMKSYAHRQLHYQLWVYFTATL